MCVYLSLYLTCYSDSQFASCIQSRWLCSRSTPQVSSLSQNGRYNSSKGDIITIRHLIVQVGPLHSGTFEILRSLTQYLFYIRQGSCLTCSRPCDRRYIPAGGAAEPCSKTIERIDRSDRIWPSRVRALSPWPKPCANSFEAIDITPCCRRTCGQPCQPTPRTEPRKLLWSGWSMIYGTER